MTTYRLGEHEAARLVSEDAQQLVVEATYQPHGKPPPFHMHPFQVERFSVQEGRLTATVGSRQVTLDAGAELVVEPRTPHRMWNADDVAATVRWVTDHPAGRRNGSPRSIGWAADAPVRRSSSRCCGTATSLDRC